MKTLCGLGWALKRWHGVSNCSKCLVWSRATVAVPMAYWSHNLASCIYYMGKPTHPPPAQLLIHGTLNIAGPEKNYLKNQPMQLTALYVIMIAISLLYFY